MFGIQVLAGTPGTFFSTLVQVLPPSRVTCRRPSSVPTQITPFCSGLGAMAMMVVKFSAPLTSRVRPPLSSCCCHSGLLVVRSGLIDRPGLAAVGRLVDELAAEVDRAGLEGVGGEAGVPVEAELLAALGRRRLDGARLAGAQVPARRARPPATRSRRAIESSGSGRVSKPSPPPTALPVVVADAARLPDRARAAPGAVVLQAAVDVVRAVSMSTATW